MNDVSVINMLHNKTAEDLRYIFDIHQGFHFVADLIRYKSRNNNVLSSLLVNHLILRENFEQYIS